MPNIREYNPTRRRLDPSERGYQAFETAGRRVGPLYNASAQDVREQGRIEGRGIQGRMWPFDILALQRDAERGVRPTGGGGGFVVQQQRRGRAHGEVSAGAAGMSRLARNLAGRNDRPVAAAAEDGFFDREWRTGQRTAAKVWHAGNQGREVLFDDYNRETGRPLTYEEAAAGMTGEPFIPGVPFDLRPFGYDPPDSSGRGRLGRAITGAVDAGVETAGSIIDSIRSTLGGLASGPIEFTAPIPPAEDR